MAIVAQIELEHVARVQHEAHEANANGVVGSIEAGVDAVEDVHRVSELNVEEDAHALRVLRVKEAGHRRVHAVVDVHAGVHLEVVLFY